MDHSIVVVMAKSILKKPVRNWDFQPKGALFTINPNNPELPKPKPGEEPMDWSYTNVWIRNRKVTFGRVHIRYIDLFYYYSVASFK